MNAHLLLQFPTPIVILPPEEQFDGSDFEKLCYSHRNNDLAGVMVSNRNGWQSTSKDVFSDPFLRPMSDYIIRRLQMAVAILPLRTANFSVVHSWINISPTGAYNKTHTHPGAHFAGVFYVKCAGKDSGMISFEADQMRGLEMQHYTEEAANNYLLWPAYSFVPEPGGIILFPGSAPHSVESNLSGDDRISVSFNLIMH